MNRFRKLLIWLTVEVLLLSLPVLAFKPWVHLEITKGVLSLISKTVGGQTYRFTDKAIQEVMQANEDTDCALCQIHSEYHFDDEDFKNASQRLVDLKYQILADLAGSSPNGAKAREHLGQALHTLQDFYAHSTRVELGLSGFDSVLGLATISGPDYSKLTCPSDPATIAGDGLTFATSGFFPLPQPCTSSIPPGKCRHGMDDTVYGIFSTCEGINKDAPDRKNYQAAHDLAVTATARYVNTLILNDPSITNNAKAVKALMGIAGTLGMVVDTTGSMSDIIAAVQSNITNIVNSIVGTPDEPNQYLLEPFNDPTWGPPTLTSDASTFLQQVNSLTANGGGDCPELSMHGLLEAVNTADNDSTLYMFTDASAKDSAMYPSVGAVALSKGIKVNPIVFGSCSPIDPAYNAVAVITGGQLFVLDRSTETGAIFPLINSQIGPPQVTISHIDAFLDGSRDIQFPVDSAVTALSVSTTFPFGANGPITLKRPDGSVVNAGDSGVTLAGFSAGAIYVINSPASGTWDLQLNGFGAYSVDVRGKTTLDQLGQFPNFSSFDFVTLTGRVAHTGYFPIPDQPIAGQAQTVVARLTGTTSNVVFKTDEFIVQTLALSQGDPNAMPSDYVGKFTPSEPFRVIVTGQDASGVAFQRTSKAIQPNTISVTPTSAVDGLPQGQTVTLTFTVQDVGAADTFTITSSDGKSFVRSVTPTSLSLASGGTGTVTVTLSVPTTAALGTTDSITLIVASANSPNITNSAVQNLEVISGTAGLGFIPVTPCRIADTRNPDGPLGGPAMSAGSSRDFPFPDSSCGIPPTAVAYSLNFTVVPHGTLGYLTVWTTGQSQPLASTLNSPDGRIKANAAIIPAGTGGSVSAFVTDDTDLIIDINGYFISDTTQLQFYPLTPCRVLDTRMTSDLGLGAPSMMDNEERELPVQLSSCGIPSTALAYSMNFTVVPQQTLGYLTVWPSGGERPVVSTLNALNGAVTANAAIVPAGTNGDISAFVTNATDLIADINGYFAPGSSGGQWLYTVAPCRILDTRYGVGAFDGDLTAQVTGKPCTVPSNAQAVAFNATVVPQQSLGYLTLWPAGASQPVVSTLNALDGAITSNMAIVPTTDGSIDAFTTGKADLILDIFSYFAP